ncbi:MAG TPA: SgcJ/EcaC family oxidoreductase [Gammaproteobacteria bacterium]|nr:SgcJ/EcaC family oxidoreductase [Gammaproteobacteria bacterium]
MNRRNRLTILLCTWLMLLAGTMSIASAGEKDDIRAVIKAYEKALNASDVEAVLGVYAPDGVFMPSGKPTATGTAGVREAYRGVFRALDLDVVFHFEDIVQRGDLAFVRTTSSGKIVILGKGPIENHTRELFVLRKVDGEWKISRYMFNEPTRPPKKKCDYKS